MLHCDLFIYFVPASLVKVVQRVVYWNGFSCGQVFSVLSPHRHRCSSYLDPTGRGGDCSQLKNCMLCGVFLSLYGLHESLGRVLGINESLVGFRARLGYWNIVPNKYRTLPWGGERIPFTDMIPKKSFTVPFVHFWNIVTENTPPQKKKTSNNAERQTRTWVCWMKIIVAIQAGTYDRG